MTTLTGERYIREQQTIGNDTLFSDYFGDVYRYVRRRVPTDQMAEDISAEIFIAALNQNPRSFQDDMRPWLYGIARRKIVTMRRHRQDRLEAQLPDNLEDRSVSPLGDVLRKEGTHTLVNLLHSLPEVQREVLLLFYVEELSARQISKVVCRSTFAVNSLLQRARQSVLRRGEQYFLEAPQER